MSEPLRSDGSLLKRSHRGFPGLPDIHRHGVLLWHARRTPAVSDVPVQEFRQSRDDVRMFVVQVGPLAYVVFQVEQLNGREFAGVVVVRSRRAPATGARAQAQL